MTNNQSQTDLQLTTSLLEGLVPNGPTDPIATTGVRSSGGSFANGSTSDCG